MGAVGASTGGGAGAHEGEGGEAGDGDVASVGAGAEGAVGILLAGEPFQALVDGLVGLGGDERGGAFGDLTGAAVDEVGAGGGVLKAGESGGERERQAQRERQDEDRADSPSPRSWLTRAAGH